MPALAFVIFFLFLLFLLLIHELLVIFELNFATSPQSAHLARSARHVHCGHGHMTGTPRGVLGPWRRKKGKPRQALRVKSPDLHTRSIVLGQ